MKTPEVTVVIPTYQREEVLVNTIKEVLSQDFEAFELIVVDQTETHDESTVRFLNSIKDPCFRYFNVSPPSLPAARNFAIKKSRSDIILFIDDDVQLSKDFIAAHYHLHTTRPGIKAVAGRVATKLAGPTPELFSFNWFGKEQNSFDCPYSQEATSFLGCNFSIKKEIVKEVGLFDTTYSETAMREESDMAFRIKKAGYTIWYEPEASLFHLLAEKGGCRNHEKINDSQSFYKNDLYFTLKRVSLFLLPFVLSAKIGQFILHRPVKKIPSRSWLFMKGLMFALTRKFRRTSVSVFVKEKTDQVYHPEPGDSLKISHQYSS